MGKKTKIDWCDSTFNPVTGCLHGCEYCYARKIAERFGGLTPDSKLHELSELNRCTDGSPDCYPWGFAPTFHRYKLDEPQHWKAPRNIFVVSMGDLFGDWVPDEWIREVLNACEAAPQHRYLFLTKNPDRLNKLMIGGHLPNAYSNRYWFGTTWVCNNSSLGWGNGTHKTFVSIEPILSPLNQNDLCRISCMGWVIVGAETGNRKGKVVPKKEWIMDISDACKEAGKPIFMKESLRGIMGDDFRQEFPWEV